jgi:hypothetical protein
MKITYFTSRSAHRQSEKRRSTFNPTVTAWPAKDMTSTSDGDLQRRADVEALVEKLDQR